jgi:molecular chaperone GrpE
VGEATERPEPEPEVGDLKARVADLEGQVAELEDRWRRAMADLDNLRKRVARDRDQQRDEERARAAAAWLPVLDNLELAIRHSEADPAALVQGLQGVREQAVDVLSRLGFPRQDAAGEVFDPARHEAVAVVTRPDLPPGTVIEVLRPGYGGEGHQLRPAAVVVSSAQAP